MRAYKKIIKKSARKQLAACPSASAVAPDGKERTYPFQLPTTLTVSPGLVHRKSTCGWKGLRTRELLVLVWAWSRVQEGPCEEEAFECDVGWDEDGGTDDAVAALIVLCENKRKDSPDSCACHAGRGLGRVERVWGVKICVSCAGSGSEGGVRWASESCGARRLFVVTRSKKGRLTQAMWKLQLVKSTCCFYLSCPLAFPHEGGEEEEEEDPHALRGEQKRRSE